MPASLHRIRVAVTDLPRMLEEIVIGLISAERDLELVPVDDQDARGIVQREHPDVLVLGCPGDDLAEIAAPLLELHPRLRVLSVEPDGRTGHVYELCPQLAHLEELSPQGLLAAIRHSPSPAT